MLIDTPIGKIEPLKSHVERVRALSDDELCQELNTCDFIDPCAITEASRYRPNIGYEWPGKGFYIRSNTP